MIFYYFYYPISNKPIIPSIILTKNNKGLLESTLPFIGGIIFGKERVQAVFCPVYKSN